MQARKEDLISLCHKMLYINTKNYRMKTQENAINYELINESINQSLLEYWEMWNNNVHTSDITLENKLKPNIFAKKTYLSSWFALRGTHIKLWGQKVRQLQDEWFPNESNLSWRWEIRVHHYTLEGSTDGVS